MNNQMYILRSLLIALAAGIFIFDMVSWLSGHGQPLAHRNALLTCILLWFASLFYPQNSDDDWAGQF